MQTLSPQHKKMARSMNIDRSLSNTHTAIQYLYEESLLEEDQRITDTLAQALLCCELLMEGNKSDEYCSQDSFLYLCFLRAVLGLEPDKVNNLLAIVNWLSVNTLRVTN